MLARQKRGSSDRRILASAIAVKNPRPPRRAEASRRKSVRRSGEAKRSHPPSPLRRPVFCGPISYLGGGGHKAE
jgi:hypothetical protein